MHAFERILYIYIYLSLEDLSLLTTTRCVKYWLRISKVPSSRYVKMVNNMRRSMAEEGTEKWASALRDFLCTNGFPIAWWNGSMGDEHAS